MERPAALAAKFAVLTALSGIFIDAVIAHGLYWDNDPYWTYWITKTFLIATVFLVGTALMGVGIWQGIAITVVHTVILTAYYDWFAPIGLPQEPEWLDMEHLWITGLPAHFSAILSGYFLSLWMWRRYGASEQLHVPDSRSVLIRSLIATVVVLVVDGLVTHGLLFKSFPGWTYFVQHLLITAVFVYLWLAFVGSANLDLFVGSLVLSMVWLGYDMYVGPLGLPQEVRYLSYSDLWLRAWPGALIAGLVGMFAAVKLLRPDPRVTAGLLIFLIPGGAWASGLRATARSEGPCMHIVGPNPVDMASSVAGNGSVEVQVVEHGNRWSHVQNMDEVKVLAEWTANGSQWRVAINKPMPRHPHGRYTVWNGVVFNHEMHGDTGIGTNKLPLMKPEIALWGWAVVERDGEVIAKAAPAHLMATSAGEMKGVMLEVDTEDKGLVGVPDGYLHAMWHDIDALNLPIDAQNQRKLIGWVATIFLPIILGFMAARARPTPTSRRVETPDSPPGV